MLRKYNDLFILLVIWFVSIYSVIVVASSKNSIGAQNYIGYNLLIVVSVLRFTRIKRFKTVLGILLVLGSINVVQFTYLTMTFVFTWTPLGHRFPSLGIQPLSVCLLLLLIIMNFSDFMGVISGLFSEDSTGSVNKQNQNPENHVHRSKIKIED